MSKSEKRVQIRHPDPTKSMPAIDHWKYEAVRQAILTAVPKSGEGLLFKELPGRVREHLPADKLENLGSVSWYTTTVKLDLESRGEVKRVPGSRPQRLLR
ncbi:MAG: hypothetical protein WBP10_11325 [Thermoanaerobaculia bacterium]|jgi:hypothetical protein